MPQVASLDAPTSRKRAQTRRTKLVEEITQQEELPTGDEVEIHQVKQVQETKKRVAIVRGARRASAAPYEGQLVDDANANARLRRELDEALNEDLDADEPQTGQRNVMKEVMIEDLEDEEDIHPPDYETPIVEEHEDEEEVEEGAEVEERPQPAATKPLSPRTPSKSIKAAIRRLIPGKTQETKKTRASQTTSIKAVKKPKPKPKPKSKSKRNETYKTYLYKVLKQIHPDLGVSSQAMGILNDFVSDIYERLVKDAVRAQRLRGKTKTLTASDFQTAVRLLLPGNLGNHAEFEGKKAVSRSVQ